MTITAVRAFAILPFHERFQVPAEAHGSEVGIIVLLRLLGSPQQVARVTKYHVSRIYQVKSKYKI